jgi:hypothetical protein
MSQQEFLERDAGSATDGARGTVPGWNRLALEAMAAARVPGPLAARALAILHTAIYNAWAAYDDTARQTDQGVAVRLPRGERHGGGKTVAIAHAAHLVLSTRFPAQRAVFDAHLAGLLRSVPPPRPVSDRRSTTSTLTPAGIGRVQAASLLDACGLDGALPLPPGAALGTLCERWCTLARRLCDTAAYDDDRDVLLFFVLANALDHAVIAMRAPIGDAVRPLLPARLPAPSSGSWRDACDGAAGAALRRFAGEPDAAADPSWGQTLGGLVFEKARWYWQGKA